MPGLQYKSTNVSQNAWTSEIHHALLLSKASIAAHTHLECTSGLSTQDAHAACRDIAMVAPADDIVAVQRHPGMSCLTLQCVSSPVYAFCQAGPLLAELLADSSR